MLEQWWAVMVSQLVFWGLSMMMAGAPNWLGTSNRDIRSIDGNSVESVQASIAPAMCVVPTGEQIVVGAKIAELNPIDMVEEVIVEEDNLDMSLTPALTPIQKVIPSGIPISTTPLPIESPIIIEPSIIPTIAPTAVTIPTVLPSPIPVAGGDDGLHRLVNGYRREHQLNELGQITELCRVAQLRVDDIIANFSHNGFETRIGVIAYTAVGENIWYSQPFELNSVIEGWEASEGHRANLLGNWGVGCGAVKDGRAVYLFMK